MQKYGMMMASGVLGLFVLKLFMTFAVPALMMLFGFLAVFVKVSLVIAVGFVLFAIFKKFTRSKSEA